jgi:hypothetical protein
VDEELERRSDGIFLDHRARRDSSYSLRLSGIGFSELHVHQERDGLQRVDPDFGVTRRLW